MAFLNEQGLKTLWNRIKTWVGTQVVTSTSSASYDAPTRKLTVKISVGTNNTDASVVLPEVSNTSSGLMTKDQLANLAVAYSKSKDLVWGKGTVLDSSILPSYVDDVVEGYLNENIFYKEVEHTNPITGEAGKIYVDLGDTDNKVYRYAEDSKRYIPISDVPASVLKSISDLSNNLTKVVSGLTQQSVSVDSTSQAVLIKLFDGTKINTYTIEAIGDTTINSLQA